MHNGDQIMPPRHNDEVYAHFLEIYVPHFRAGRAVISVGESVPALQRHISQPAMLPKFRDNVKHLMEAFSDYYTTSVFGEQHRHIRRT